MSSSSTAQVPEHKPSEDPNPPPGAHNSTPRRPIYQTETTGNHWTDVREAFKVCIVVHIPPLPSVSRCCPFLSFVRFLTDVFDVGSGPLVEIVAL